MRNFINGTSWLLVAALAAGCGEQPDASQGSFAGFDAHGIAADAKADDGRYARLGCGEQANARVDGDGYAVAVVERPDGAISPRVAAEGEVAVAVYDAGSGAQLAVGEACRPESRCVDPVEADEEGTYVVVVRAEGEESVEIGVGCVDSEPVEEILVACEGATYFVEEEGSTTLVFDDPEATRVAIEPSADLALFTIEGAPLEGADHYPVPLRVQVRPRRAAPEAHTEDSALPLFFAFSGDDGETWLCDGGAKAKVVKLSMGFKVKSGGGSNFSTHEKMLVTATATATATLKPNVGATYAWTYDGDGTFTPNNGATTRFDAGTTFTTAAQVGHRVRVAVTVGKQVLRASRKVTLTAPRELKASGRFKAGFNYTTGLIRPGQTKVTLAPRKAKVRYQILDQFKKPIHDSAYGGKAPQVRENIGAILTSPLARMRTALTARRATPIWQSGWANKKKGSFNDALKFLKLPALHLMEKLPGGWRWDPALGAAVLSLGNATHAWELSVSGQVAKQATWSTFGTNELARQAANRSRSYRSVYRVRTSNGP